MIDYLLIIVVTILLAISDGLYDNGKKKISKIIELVGLSSIFLLGYTTEYPIWLILICAVLIRFSIFSITYNITRKLPLLYLGTTDYFDLLLRKVNPAILPMWYLISLCLAFGFLYNY
jgi:hypothetical protein